MSRNWIKTAFCPLYSMAMGRPADAICKTVTIAIAPLVLPTTLVVAIIVAVMMCTQWRLQRR